MTEISDTPEVDEDLLHLVVLSGLNNEAQNIIFGCAILKEINVEAVTWMLHHFRESNMKNGNQFEDSDVVISDYKDCISLAVEIVFSHNTTHLFCQKSIKAILYEYCIIWVLSCWQITVTAEEDFPGLKSYQLE